MISELGNENGRILDLIDNAMFIGDSARPVAGEAMFERFRFSYALVGHPLNLTD
jgi:hypothetical protein